MYRSHNIASVVGFKFRRSIWAGHVIKMEEGRNTFKLLTGKPTRKISLGAGDGRTTLE